MDKVVSMHPAIQHGDRLSALPIDVLAEICGRLQQLPDFLSLASSCQILRHLACVPSIMVSS